MAVLSKSDLGKVDLEWDESTLTWALKVQGITVLQVTRSGIVVGGSLGASSLTDAYKAVLFALLSGDVTAGATGVTAIGAGKVLSAMLDAQLVKYVKVTASSAELLAINATPKTVVAAPGAGYTNVIQRSLLVLNYNSAAYANNGILGLYETNASGTLLTGTLTLASFLAQTADTQKELHPSAASATTGLTRGDNKAIVLTQGGGESISGNSPVDVHCWYSTVPNGL